MDRTSLHRSRELPSAETLNPCRNARRFTVQLLVEHEAAERAEVTVLVTTGMDGSRWRICQERSPSVEVWTVPTRFAADEPLAVWAKVRVRVTANPNPCDPAFPQEILQFSD